MRVFEGCSSLTSVNFLEVLSKIYSGAFLDCIALKKIIIPKDVRKIFGDAFTGCSSLTVLCKSEKAPNPMGQAWDNVKMILGYKTPKDEFEEAVGLYENKEYEKIYERFVKAEKSGIKRAWFYLGACHENGYDTLKDYKQAADWYEKAAKYGDDEAKIALTRFKKIMFGKWKYLT